MNVKIKEKNGLKELWKREWGYWKKDLYKWLGIQAVVMLVVFLVYIIKKAWLFKVAEGVKSLPDALQAFFAMRPDITSGNLLFFLEYALLFINISVAWNFCGKSMQRIWAEEENSNIYSMCNQWYSRRQISIVKSVFPLFALFASYGIFILYNSILAMVSGITWEQRLGDAGSLFGLWFRVCLAVGLLVSVCVCRALGGKATDISNWSGWLIFGTIVLGNLYKVRDALCWLLEYVGRSSAGLQKWLGWLDLFYWLSPLSWANPYAGLSAGKAILQAVLCAGISACFLIWGSRMYEKRDL